MHNNTVIFSQLPYSYYGEHLLHNTGVIIWWSKENNRLLRVTTLHSVPEITCDSCKIMINKKLNKKLLLWVHTRIFKDVSHWREQEIISFSRSRIWLSLYISSMFSDLKACTPPAASEVILSCWKTIPHCLAGGDFQKAYFPHHLRNRC